MTPEEQSNEDWLLDQIANAQSVHRLEHLAEIIDYDKWEDEPYTKDEELMNRLRQTWVERKEAIG